jgi:predicted RNA methylase
MPFDPDAVREFDRAGWNLAAAYEASFTMATRQFIEPMLDAAAIEGGTRVLDLCCGPGFTASAAALDSAAAPWHVHGPDGGHLPVPIACFIASGTRP